MEVKCAYTVKWIWGWTQMHGYKTVEVRSSEPRTVRVRFLFSRTPPAKIWYNLPYEHGRSS